MPGTRSGGGKRRLPFPLGANYYGTDRDSDSPEDWYARDAAADFSAMRAAHMQLVRVFVSFGQFEPQVGKYSDQAFDRLARVLDAARKNNLKAIVCLFAEDRHSGLLDMGWGRDRDPRTDPYFVQRELALVQKIVARFRSESAVLAWDLANEAFCAGFSSTEEFERWVAVMRDAVREIDADRPVILSVDPETLFLENGVEARGMLAESEFVVSHSTALYRAYAAPGPPDAPATSYLDAFLVRSAAAGTPVMLDDVGEFGLESSHAEEAAHVRTALWSGLMNGASGALVRRWRDFDTESREPFSVEPFEALVGVCDAQGVPKPSLAEIGAFASVAARIDPDRYQRAVDRAAVLMPAERYAPLPNLSRVLDPRACLHGFVAAREAHVPVTVAHEGDELSAWSVLYVPSVHALSNTAWRQMLSFVQGGGSLVLTYGGGEAHPMLNELFGVQFLGEEGPRARLECRVAQPDALDGLESFDASLEIPTFARLASANATVVATDGDGGPLVTVNRFGQGRATLVAAPLERAIALADEFGAPEAARALLRTVYGVAARSAGCALPLHCDASDVELALFQGEEDAILLVLSHAPERRLVTIAMQREIASAADVRGGEPAPVNGNAFSVPLGPRGAVGLRLAYA